MRSKIEVFRVSDGHVSFGHGSQRVIVDTPVVYNRTQ